MQEELGDRLVVQWRSFLLRPQADPDRTLLKFKKYTESWRRPAAEEPAAVFRVWESDEGPPSHSIPPHLVAKAAARLSQEGFESLHDRLLRAYFSENRDITDPRVLEDLWQASHLPPQAFTVDEEPGLLREIYQEHNEAVEHGASGVPAVRMDGRFGVLLGAQPEDTYRRWVERTLGH